MVHLIMAISHTDFVQWSVAELDPAQKHCILQVRGPRRQIRTVMVSLLSVAARSEAVYDMHFVPLRAVFWICGTWMQL